MVSPDGVALIGREFFILFFIFYFLNFYCYSITVVCLFSPSLLPTPAEPTSLHHLHPSPDFVPVSFIVVPAIPSSHCPHPTPPWPLRFPTSLSLVVYCLLISSIDYVPVKGEIRWYLSLTAWLISPCFIFPCSLLAHDL